jgi:hypothetical protein
MDSDGAGCIAAERGAMPAPGVDSGEQGQPDYEIAACDEDCRTTENAERLKAQNASEMHSG